MLLGRCVAPGQVQIKGALTNHKDVFRVSATGEVEEDEDEDEGTPSFMSQVLRPPPCAALPVRLCPLHDQWRQRQLWRRPQSYLTGSSPAAAAHGIVGLWACTCARARARRGARACKAGMTCSG
jgi:hypothetical protein